MTGAAKAAHTSRQVARRTLDAVLVRRRPERPVDEHSSDFEAPEVRERIRAYTLVGPPAPARGPELDRELTWAAGLFNPTERESEGGRRPPDPEASS
jgi:hypothetical protein